MERLEPFILFTTKAKKLLSSSFVKSYQNNSGVDFSWKRGEDLSIKQRGPDQEQIDAFVLTFRFFIQKNEPISFYSMAEAFKSEFVSDELKEKFSDAKNHLNSYLDSNSMFKIGEHITRRELLYVFIYGELSHSDREKREKYNDWMSNQFLAAFMKNEFTSILFEVLNVISYTGGICEEVLQQSK
ncbi:hypothetical protein [Alteromonas sp. BMJM2]|uniref:hypothetical protein n=1 Tax=Alteromonas sp. BMJM2 TaxID=2954241 RepID=UPI0022B3115D|nr:hypothetical protein [Alteromonas sp. BMJM2]